jgi:DNA primase small subunit
VAKDVPLEPELLAWARERFGRYYQSQRVPLPPRFSRREFASFSFAADTGMRRHIAWGSSEEFSAFLRDEVPRHVYYSTAYYRFPGHPKMAGKEWLGADLVFDLDADHLRGAATMSYADQLAHVKESLLRLLDDFLFGDFGIDPKETEIAFSGGRGYHVKIRSEAFLTLNSPERRDIVDYILGTGVDPAEWVVGPKSGGDGRTVASARISKAWPAEDAPGWAGRTTRALLADLDRWERLGTERLAAELGEMGVSGAGATRWARRLVEEGGIDRIRRSRRFDVFKQPFPEEVIRQMVSRAAIDVQGETDAPVTTDIHRLIRLPGSLHGGTGFRVTPLTREELTGFEPLRDALAPLGNESEERVEFLRPVEYPFLGSPVRGAVGSADLLPTAVALFLVLRGEAVPRPRPG